ncbi:DUF6210 family protein [Spirillospora sp. NPDC047279]|uniref:DUF6210 family protein n=1 Tax=Spirillospora sp. NPDC047279 TaxID=3155478 RepID=UPI0033FCDCCA
MTARHVLLDPYDRGGWLGAIVSAPTGVVYEQQYGGTARRQDRREGYFVPLPCEEALFELRDLFERELRSAGVWGANHRWSPEQLDRLRMAVAVIPFDMGYAPGDSGLLGPDPLRLDEGLLHQADEAWVPVVTPDGPGVLVWSNSG